MEALFAAAEAAEEADAAAGATAIDPTDLARGAVESDEEEGPHDPDG